MRYLLLCLVILSSPAWAGEPDPAAQKEIAYLIAHLGQSGCQFYRNGAWHSPTEAVDHLNMKYEYLRKRSLAPNAEAFIERAASESSLSGKPYQVKCGDDPAVPSADWLRAELARFRSGSRDAVKGP